MADNYSAAHGLTAGNSAKRETEPKSPSEGAPPVPKHERRYRKAATLSAMLAVSRSCLGCQTGERAPKGRFSCSRTPRDSSGPQVGPLGAKPRHGMPKLARVQFLTNPWGWSYADARGSEQSDIGIPFSGINSFPMPVEGRGGRWIN